MPDLPLYLDRREEMKAQDGMHVVLIGVSDYAHLPSEAEGPGDGFQALQKLDMAALSAVAILDRLLALDAAKRLVCPLKSVRLLLAPSPKEAVDPAILAKSASPEFDNIENTLIKWRADASMRQSDQTFFYYCGHGLRNSPGEVILVASDFHDPDVDVRLKNTFQLANIMDGMVPTEYRQDIASAQFYFVDACRDRPEEMDKLIDHEPGKIFEPQRNVEDYRTTPVFFATFAGGVAVALAGKPSPFAEAVAWALDEGCGDKLVVPGRDLEAWTVTPPSLRDALKSRVATARDVVATGKFKDPIIAFREDPPKFELKVSLHPDAARPEVARLGTVDVETDAQAMFDYDGANDPAVVNANIGLYRIVAQYADAARPVHRTRILAFHFGLENPYPLKLPT